MEASPKLQKAGRRFLMRLVAEAAAAILRKLADELEALIRDQEIRSVSCL